MSTEPNLSGPPQPPASASSRKRVTIAFAIGVVPLVPELFNAGDRFSLTAVTCAFAEPVAALILLCSRATRPIGLGLLLAGGVCWLFLGAICGGLIK